MAKKQYAVIPKQRAREEEIVEMSKWIKMYIEMEMLL